METALPYRKKGTNSRYEFYYILLIALSSFSFFRPAFLDNIYTRFPNFDNYPFVLLFLFALPSIVRFILKKNKYLFTLPMKMYTLAIIFSIIMANLFWGQGYVESVYGVLLPVIGSLFYFYLMEKNVDIKIIERVIIVIGMAFIIFFLFSFSVYPVKIFAYKETTDREFLRLFLFGDGFLFLFYFYAFNKFLNDRSYLWLFLALLAFLCVILNQTRVYIVCVAGISAWYLLRSKSLPLRIVTMALIFTAFLVLPQLDYIKGLQNKTQSDLGSSDEYIRIKSAKFYLNKFQPSVFTRVFGNGFPEGKDSHYAQTVNLLHTDKGYFAQDVGLVGLYAYLGLLAVIAYVIIFYRSIVKVKLVYKYSYLQMFMAFIICCSFTTDATFSASYVFPIAFTLYLIENCTVEAQKSFLSFQTNQLPDLPDPVFVVKQK